MANSTIKLFYFNVQGRAEASRLVLAAAGKKFEDVRINREQWLEMKPTSPCGTLPILEVDGKRFGQSRAIATFLAREFGLYGENNLDGLRIDEITQIAEDFIVEFGQRFFFAADAEKKAEGEKYLKEEAAPKYLGFFERHIKEAGNGFTVGSKLSLGDIAVFDVCTGFLKAFVEEALGRFPLVQALVEKVKNEEKIKEYISKRA